MKLKQSEKEKIIFSRLPKQAKNVVRSKPEEQKKVEIIVKKIFEKHGANISALAKN